MKKQKKIMLSDIEVKLLISSLGLFSDMIDGFESIIYKKAYEELQIMVINTYNKLVPEIEQVEI